MSAYRIFYEPKNASFNWILSLLKIMDTYRRIILHNSSVPSPDTLAMMAYYQVENLVSELGLVLVVDPGNGDGGPVVFTELDDIAYELGIEAPVPDSLK